MSPWAAPKLLAALVAAVTLGALGCAASADSTSIEIGLIPIVTVKFA